MTIEIVDYDPAWPDDFGVLARSLSGALGELAKRIDHIGSTSVPGLVAKDIIDIQVTVDDITCTRIVPAMQAGGFLHRPDITRDSLTGITPDSPELSKRYFKEPQGSRVANIHVREAGRLNQQYALLFRDYLRAKPEVRAAYAEIKQQLAKQFAEDVDAYYDIKDPYMDTIYFAARDWAELTGWVA